MIKAFASRQFLVFLLTGGTAAAVNFGSRLLYSQWLAFSPAVLLAYLTGMITAFVLARLFVFTESRQSVQHSALWFCAVNLLAVAQTWGISIGLADYLLPALGVEQWRHELAHAVGISVPVFTSYLGHKHLSFR